MNRIICLLTMLIISKGSMAALVDYGYFTRDTSTGLDWLDVTETRALSYDYVSSELGAGGQFEGWRYATYSEFNQLLLNLGFTNNESCGGPNYICNNQLAAYSELVEDSIQLLGDVVAANHPQVIAVGGAGASYGLLGDAFLDEFIGQFEVQVGKIHDNEFVHRDENDAVCVTCENLPANYSAAELGSFLVKASPVPIPGAAWLFGSALAGLILVRSKS